VFARFRPAIVTVSDLNDQIVAENYGLLIERTKRWSPDEVWAILRKILVDVLNVKPDEITPAARISEDLGAI
jgi:hypothetical protein